jgi:hypothetical protein
VHAVAALLSWSVVPVALSEQEGKKGAAKEKFKSGDDWCMYQSVQEEEAAAEYVPAAQGLQAALDCVSLP